MSKLNKKSTLAIVVIVAAFGLAISLSIASTMIPTAQADFHTPFGEPPGLHKNLFAPSCDAVVGTAQIASSEEDLHSVLAGPCE